MATVTGWTAAKIAAELANKADSESLSESVRDAIGSALVAGANVTITVDDAANTITISSTGGGSTDPEVVRDTIATALVAGSNVTIDVDDAANTITISAASVSEGESGYVDVYGDTYVGGATNAPAITEHSDLLNTDLADLHPITSISGLTTELNSKAPSVHTHGATAAWPDAWVPGQSYVVGDLVTAHGTLYRLKSADASNGLTTKIEVVGSYSEDLILNATFDSTKINAPLRNNDKLVAVQCTRNGAFRTGTNLNIVIQDMTSYDAGASQLTMQLWYADLPSVLSLPSFTISGTNGRVTWVVIRGAVSGAPETRSKFSASSDADGVFPAHNGALNLPSNGLSISAAAVSYATGSFPLQTALSSATSANFVCEGETGRVENDDRLMAGVFSNRNSSFSLNTYDAPNAVRLNCLVGNTVVFSAATNGCPLFDTTKWEAVYPSEGYGPKERLADNLSGTQNIQLKEKTVLVGALTYGVIRLGSGTVTNVCTLEFPEPANPLEESWCRIVYEIPWYRQVSTRLAYGMYFKLTTQLPVPARHPGAVNDLLFRWSVSKQKWIYGHAREDSGLRLYEWLKYTSDTSYPIPVLMPSGPYAYTASGSNTSNSYNDLRTFVATVLPETVRANLMRTLKASFSVHIQNLGQPMSSQPAYEYTHADYSPSSFVFGFGGSRILHVDYLGEDVEGPFAHELAHAVDLYSFVDGTTITYDGQAASINSYADHPKFIAIHNRRNALTGGNPYFNARAEFFAEALSIEWQENSGMGLDLSTKKQMCYQIYSVADPTLYTDTVAFFEQLGLS